MAEYLGLRGMQGHEEVNIRIWRPLTGGSIKVGDYVQIDNASQSRGAGSQTVVPREQSQGREVTIVHMTPDEHVFVDHIPTIVRKVTYTRRAKEIKFPTTAARQAAIPRCIQELITAADGHCDYTVFTDGGWDTKPTLEETLFKLSTDRANHACSVVLVPPCGQRKAADCSALSCLRGIKPTKCLPHGTNSNVHGIEILCVPKSDQNHLRLQLYSQMAKPQESADDTYKCNVPPRYSPGPVAHSI